MTIETCLVSVYHTHVPRKTHGRSRSWKKHVSSSSRVYYASLHSRWNIYLARKHQVVEKPKLAWTFPCHELKSELHSAVCSEADGRVIMSALSCRRLCLLLWDDCRLLCVCLCTSLACQLMQDHI